VKVTEGMDGGLAFLFCWMSVGFLCVAGVFAMRFGWNLMYDCAVLCFNEKNATLADRWINVCVWVS